MHLLSLPNEVILELFKYLNTSDILSLRQTCTHVAGISKDKLIWSNLIQQLRTRVPLPPNVLTTLEEWSSDALESLVISAELVDQLWLEPRDSPPVKLQNKRGELLFGVEIFLDRWILAVYLDGYINLWDAESFVDKENHGRWCFVYTGNDKTTSYQAVVDDAGGRLLVVITRAHLPGTWVAALYEIQLSDPPLNLHFTLLCTFPISSSRIAQQIHPRERMIALSQLSSVELARWSEESETDITSVLISNMESDALEEMFTTILSLRILSDKYVFVFKTRSIELYPLPEATTHRRHNIVNEHSSRPLLKHVFPSYNFRDVQISDVEIEVSNKDGSSEPIFEGTRYKLKILASDIIQGLFFFIVTISIPLTQGEIATLDVNLAAIYALANHIPLRSSASRRSQLSRKSTSSRTESSMANESYRFQLFSGPATPTSPRTSSFVSAYALGTQGMRAVWIERRRGTTEKEIITCRLNAPRLTSPGLSILDSDLDSSSSNGDHGDDGLGVLPQALDGQVVYSSISYDLREDITHCALGEVSGKIILGNRSGDIFVLETGV
ncbi:hypothetical protein C8R42DRAFT_674455 [Lentinula raphanica]|nr:hypothetical protein C8R42DRAFT_674455 [Lentinula raphanica]